jgi:aldose sugar dehydrogenase
VLAVACCAATLLAGCSSGDASSDGGPTTSAPVPSSSSPATAAPSRSPSTTRPSVSRTSATVPSGLRVAGTVATGFTSPWGLAFLPDGDALVSERDTGKIKRVLGGGDVRTVGIVPGIFHGGEGGLLGIAVDPHFAQDRWLYAYFTADDGNRIVRMRYAGRGLGKPSVLVHGIPSSPIHNGGRLTFGPDGTLWAGTGDASLGAETAQDPSSLGGKILHIDPDGSVPADNPGSSPAWDSGHRNVQGLAFDSRGRLWASEFGQDTFDELNLIRRGANYGWPFVEGKGTGGGRYVSPQAVWPTDDASPSGIAILDDVVYMAALKGERLWQIPVRGEQAGHPRVVLDGYGRLRTVALAPDGSLWLITSNTDGRGSPRPGDDRILRLVPEG